MKRARGQALSAGPHRPAERKCTRLSRRPREWAQGSVEVQQAGGGQLRGPGLAQAPRPACPVHGGAASLPPGGRALPTGPPARAQTGLAPRPPSHRPPPPSATLREAGGDPAGSGGHRLDRGQPEAQARDGPGGRQPQSAGAGAAGQVERGQYVRPRPEPASKAGLAEPGSLCCRGGGSAASGAGTTSALGPRPKPQADAQWALSRAAHGTPVPRGCHYCKTENVALRQMQPCQQQRLGAEFHVLDEPSSPAEGHPRSRFINLLKLYLRLPACQKRACAKHLNFPTPPTLNSWGARPAPPISAFSPSSTR